MKKLEALVAPCELEAVVRALREAGASGMTAVEMRSIGGPNGHHESYRGVEYAVDLHTRIKLEILVPDDRLEAVANAVASHAGPDGAILVLPAADALRVRTRERGDGALT